MTAIHYWFPIIYGKLYNSRLANLGLLVFLLGYLLLYLSIFSSGILAIFMKYDNDVLIYNNQNILSKTGPILILIGFHLIIINLFSSVRKGKAANKNPWNSSSPEWTISKPLIKN